MKIVFAGTPTFSAFHLDLLIKSENEVAAVLTQPDRKSGRGKKISVSPVKTLAQENQILVLQPKSLKKNTDVINQLKDIEPELILVVAYGLILPKEFISLPKFGCINVHASLLPRWRGAAPIERTLMEGDTEGGITYMRMNEGLDTGPIMKLLPCPIESEENSESLEKKYQNLSELNLLKFLEDISSRKVAELSQDSSKATYAEKIERQETEILWGSESAELIERKIRALFPKYGSFTFLGNKRVKILNASLEGAPKELSPGKIYTSDENRLYVGCLNRKCLRINRLQIEGKLPVDAKDFIKGNKEKIVQEKKFSSSLEK